MTDLLKPKEIKLKDIDGEERTYILSRIPAIAARELISQYPLSALPKLGDYQVNEEMMLKLMCYIEVVNADGNHFKLNSRAMIDNHVPDGETLYRLEMAMMEYNTNFLHPGKISKKLDGFTVNIKQLLSQTLTQLSQSLSKPGKQRSKK